MPLLEAMPISGEQEQPSSREILAQLERDNHFVVSLDQQGEWFRYHHLFKDLLRHKLKAENNPGAKGCPPHRSQYLAGSKTTWLKKPCATILPQTIPPRLHIWWPGSDMP